MRFGPSQPFQPWESNYGKRFGEAAAAVIYAASNIVSWEYANDIPKRQAAANKEVIQKQKEDYDEISADMRSKIKAALDEYLEDINSITEGQDLDNAYPDVPRAAEYVPVNACCVQRDTIECNITHTDRADDYVRYVNRLHEQNDLIHLLSMCPDFLVNLDIMNKAIQYLMRGILPTGDVVDILTDNAELSALSGRIGASRKTTARDLGISKLRAQAAGRKEFREMTAWMNSAVSPMQRQHDITEMMLNPADRISLALTQAQLIQNSLQNKRNQLAQKHPSKLARIEMRLQKYITKLQSQSTRAMLTNTFVPNYALTTPTGVGANPGQLLAGLGPLMGKIGESIGPASKSWFFGAPSQQEGAQVGYDQNPVISDSKSGMW